MIWRLFDLSKQNRWNIECETAAEKWMNFKQLSLIWHIPEHRDSSSYDDPMNAGEGSAILGCFLHTLNLCSTEQLKME